MHYQWSYSACQTNDKKPTQIHIVSKYTLQKKIWYFFDLILTEDICLWLRLSYFIIWEKIITQSKSFRWNIGSKYLLKFLWILFSFSWSDWCGRSFWRLRLCWKNFFNWRMHIFRLTTKSWWCEEKQIKSYLDKNHRIEIDKRWKRCYSIINVSKENNACLH